MTLPKDNDPLNRLCLCPGVELLRQASICAHNCARRLWEFAVEIDTLFEAGLTVTDLRWLIAKGYAEHADETTRLSDRVRRFRRIKSLIFTPCACLALTDAGEARITLAISSGLIAEGNAATRSCAATDKARADVTGVAALTAAPDSRSHRSGRLKGSDLGEPSAGTSPKVDAIANTSKTTSQKPFWDAALHELRFGPKVVKRFRRPAKSQELILAAFQEEGWPAVIDDPLPMDPDQNPRQRLHYTVHHMNRVQRPRLIHFYVNGNGQSIYWQPARDRRAKGARRARKRR